MRYVKLLLTPVDKGFGEEFPPPAVAEQLVKPAVESAVDVPNDTLVVQVWLVVEESLLVLRVLGGLVQGGVHVASQIEDCVAGGWELFVVDLEPPAYLSQAEGVHYLVEDPVLGGDHVPLDHAKDCYAASERCWGVSVCDMYVKTSDRLTSRC